MSARFLVTGAHCPVISLFLVAAQRDLAEEKKMLIPGRMSSALAKAGGGRKCQKLLTDVCL